MALVRDVSSLLAKEHRGVAATLLAVGGALILDAVLWPRIEGDTSALVSGAQAALACFSAGIAQRCPGVVHFPLFQYLPAVAWRALGFTHGATLELLAGLSGVAVAGLVAMSVGALWTRGHRVPALLMALLLTASPLLFYASSSFNEGPAAALTLAFCWAVLSKRGAWLQGVLCFATGLTKEVAPPFLFLLGVLGTTPLTGAALWAERRRLALLAGAAALAVATNAGFNVFRFGVPYNETQFDPLFLVPDFAQHVSNFLGLALSPNGGVLFFFPLFLPLWVGIGAVLIRRNEPSLAAWLPHWGVGALFGALLVGLSRWFSPFGWVAWGPRLLVPWIPALSLLLLWRFGDEVTEGARWVVLSRRGFAFLALAILTLGVPLLSVPYTADAMAAWFAPGVDCPHPAIIQADTAYFYECLNRLMWRPHDLILLDVAGAALLGNRVFPTLLLGGAHGWLWLALRAECLKPSGPR